MSKMPNPNQPEISIVVPLHNRLDCTRIFLKSLLKTIGSIQFELIFVNDSSEDGSKEFLNQTTTVRTTHLSPHSSIGISRL
jgi:glycosyltransferase involved in cell wall biosynthesis